MKTITLHRWAAYGDVIQCTVIASKLHAQGWRVRFSTLPAVCEVLRHHPHIFETVKFVRDTAPVCDISFDNDYERSPERKTRPRLHISLDVANRWLTANRHDVLDYQPMEPVLTPQPDLAWMVGRELERFRRPWIMIVPRSNGYACRTVAREVWSRVACKLPGTVFWTGTDPAPMACGNRLKDLRLRSFPQLVAGLSKADLVLTVDTGPLHVARAFRKPIVLVEQSTRAAMITTPLTNLVTVAPDLDCLGCNLEKCPINEIRPPCQKITAQLVVDAAKRMLP